MARIHIHDLNWQQHANIDPVVDGMVRRRGLVPRNYTTHPLCSSPAAHAFTMDLIARSEWSQRCADMKKSSSRIQDLRGSIKSRDQNGKGYSHSADTEILTEKGWVFWPDWNHKDLLATVNLQTQMMEFQAPLEWHAYEYNEEMVYSTNRRVDFGVTGNHRMIVRKWDEQQQTLSDLYTEQRADQLGWYVGLMSAPKGWLGVDLERLSLEDDREYLGDDFLALVSLICSDGYASSALDHSGLVSFCCFHQDRIPMVRALAHRVGFKEQPSRPGVWKRENAHALAAWIRAHCYTGNNYRSPYKKLPDLIKSVSMRQIRHFFHYWGDKNHGGQEVYYSSSQRMIGDLQELLLRIGKRGTITEREPRESVYRETGQPIKSRTTYTMVVGGTDKLCLDRKKHIETDRYKGLVYCATVPNGTLITRRNGTVLISGNCWQHSGGTALVCTRFLAGEPYADISPYMGACIQKNYQDEGGWGAQGVDWICENGLPDSKFWPQQSMSRSNDTPEMRANAKLHRFTEGFWDLSAAQYDRNLTWDQVITCLLCRIPVVTDYNWWSHSVCAIEAIDGASEWGNSRDEISGKLLDLRMFMKVWGMDDPVTAGFGVLIWNSWGDSWSDRGMGPISGSKAVPDGSVAPRVSTPSIN